MKKITIVFLTVFLALFAGMLGYVALSEDFEEPVLLAANDYGVTADSPIWDLTFDDLVAYLEEKGFIKEGDYEELSGGIATVQRQYNSIDLYWWDLDSLDRESEEYANYVSLCENGYIDLWGSGNLMYLDQMGPFGIQIWNYPGDSQEVIDAFHEFGVE